MLSRSNTMDCLYLLCFNLYSTSQMLRAWLLELPLVPLWLVQLSTYLDLQNNMGIKSMMV
jgi:hypothetical protein